MPTPTLKDVAAAAGVSVASASRALHGSVGGVTADTQRRVQTAAKQLGYVRARAPHGKGAEHRRRRSAYTTMQISAHETWWRQQLAEQLLALAARRQGAEAVLLKHLAALAAEGKFPHV